MYQENEFHSSTVNGSLVHGYVSADMIISRANPDTTGVLRINNHIKPHEFTLTGIESTLQLTNLTRWS